MTTHSAVFEQGSPEWLASRAGRITASEFGDAIAIAKSGKNSGKSTAARERVMFIKAFERTAGIAKHQINSQSMTWGKDLEPYAGEAYEVETGNILQKVGLIVHPKFDYIAASPDALIGDRGGYESKCPKDEAVHMGTWIYGMPAEHIPQVQGGMMCTGRDWWDFVSYDPRCGEKFQIYIQRIYRDDEYIDETLLPGLLQFELELQAMVKKLEGQWTLMQSRLADKVA